MRSKGRNLTRTPKSRTFDASASAAAFPLGGIGTGNVSLGARGELRDWELFNGPDKNEHLPNTFFAIRAQVQDRDEATGIWHPRVEVLGGDMAGIRVEACGQAWTL